MKKYTKEEKAEYLKNLRKAWSVSKEMAESDKVAMSVFEGAKLIGVSYLSFFNVLSQMQEQGLEGLPYVDCKTFGKWQESGFGVKRGEHSTLNGIVWIGDNKEEPENSSHHFPKVYHLFHKSQVAKL